MSELTEKLKLGILRDGLYYFRMPDGDVDISDNYELMRLKYTEDGDVFEYHNTRYIITEINNMGYIYIFRPKEQPEFISQTFANDGRGFLKMKYLGKSKANINDLFKTENEE